VLDPYSSVSEGVRNQFKLRRRYNAEQDGSPELFEVKKRSDVIVRKSRELVTAPPHI
jgi:hypothetical protein